MMKLRRLALAIVVIAGCRSASTDPIIIEEPVERPLPPASGTPIGILLDESAKLELRADQLETLRALDQKLATRNDQIDAELRELDRPPELPAGAPGVGGRGRGGGMGGPPGGGMGGGGMGGPPGGGMGGGGMGGGGMGGPPSGGGGGGMGGPPSGGGRRGGGHGGKGPRGGGPPGGHGDPAARGRLLEERTANIRDAIARALDVLDPQQRTIATQILDDHGAADPSRLPPPGAPPTSDETSPAEP